MKQPDPQCTAVVIPAYNEAVTIGQVVKNATAIGAVVVVNDGSKDDTARIAAEAGATVISLAGNQGYEGALGSGIQYAIDQHYAFALTMDADGQHRLESAQLLLASMDGCDVVVGIRQTKQRVTEFIAGWVGAVLWKISDPFSGLKLYRLDRCKALGKFDSHRLVGAEMLVRAHRQGLVLKSLPIQTEQRADAPRFGSSLRANYKIARAIVLLVAIDWGLLK
jgi:glycosyltransferase involved in cell wall biosynthesis